jgi:uncharacterized BrkB/YihY/UPF0761 family membrane protein
MIWGYWNSFALLAGAELNSHLAKENSKGPLLPKEQPVADDTLDRAA